MPRFAALLRGINVGGHRVAMSHLKRLFEALKLANVETFINSGNVVFETRSAGGRTLEERIERQLERALSYAVPTFLRSMDELKAIDGLEPFPRTEVERPRHSVIVYFLAEPLPRDAQRRFEALRTPRDEFHVNGREVYWLSRGSILETLVPESDLRRAFDGRVSTTRNINTVHRMVAKFGG
jgi:uncharacterized protein (DUF1697 family)